MTSSQTPASPQKFVRCPGCSERLGVRDEDAGRKAKCAKCGRVFQIGGSATGAQTAAAPTMLPEEFFADKPAAPAVVAFECSLCQTRITARAADAGHKVKCPDCGRKNVIPEPPKPKAAKQPAAFEGEQLELWAADEKTWEAEFPTGPNLYPVECRVCQTLMYATEAQIGRELKCPDCGATTIAKRAAPKKPSGPLPTPPGKEYQLDPASAPAPRVAPVPIAIRDAEMHEHARATTVGPDGRLIVQKKERQERPVRPPVPLIQGVLPMLITEEILARWVMTSILFGAAAWFVYDGLMTPVGLGSIMAIFLIIMGMVLTLLWLTFAAPTFMAVVAESSEGHDRLHEPPGWSPLEWLGETMYLVNAIALAGMPGMLAWSLGAPVAAELLLGAALVVAVAIFPLAYMGALLENTSFGVISPKLLGTLFRRPGQWLLFYIEVALIAAGTAAACTAIALWAPAAVYAAPLIVMGAMFLLMRLMGRLAWWLAEVLPAADDDEDEEVDDAAAAHPHLAAARAAKRAEAKAEAAAPQAK